MANEKNLKHFSKENREESVKNGRKGGIASGEAKRKKKTMKDMALMLLHSDLPEGEYSDIILKLFPGAQQEDLRYDTAILANQIKKALTKGDTKAASFVRDTAGEAPVYRQEVTNIDSDGYCEVLIAGKDVFGDRDRQEVEDDEEEAEEEE